MKFENAKVSNQDTHQQDTDDHSAEIAVAVAVADVFLERMAAMRGGSGPSESHNNNRSDNTRSADPGQDYSKRSGPSLGATTPNPTTSTPNNPPASGAEAVRLVDAAIAAALQRAASDLSQGYGLVGGAGQLPLTPVPVPQVPSHRPSHLNHSAERATSPEAPKQSPERAHEPRNREDGGREPIRLRPDGGELRREDVAREVAKVLCGLSEDRGVKRDAPTIVDKGDLPKSTTAPEHTPAEPRLAEPKRDPTSTSPQERSPNTPPEVQAILNDPRNDAARIIQQLLNNDTVNKTPQPQNNDLTAGRPQQNSLNPSNQDTIPSQHSSISTTQSSIAAQTEQLRDILQSTLDRSTPRPSHHAEIRPQSQASTVGTTGDYTRVEPPNRHLQPSNDVQREGRAAPSTPNTGNDPSTIRPAPGAPGRGDQPIRPVSPDGILKGESPITPVGHAEQGRSLLKAINAAAEKVLNITLLRKLDTALETAVISAAAAVTLGVIGTEMVTKEILKVALGLLELLKGDKTENASIESVIQDLEEMSKDRGIEKIEKPAELVADITGQITLSGSGAPLEGIIVDGGSLGLAISDISGHFRFCNVPLDTGFTLLIRDKSYTFDPSQIVGTVSASNHYTVTATRV